MSVVEEQYPGTFSGGTGREHLGQTWEGITGIFGEEGSAEKVESKKYDLSSKGPDAFI